MDKLLLLCLLRLISISIFRSLLSCVREFAHWGAPCLGLHRNAFQFALIDLLHHLPHFKDGILLTRIELSERAQEEEKQVLEILFLDLYFLLKEINCRQSL